MKPAAHIALVAICLGIVDVLKLKPKERSADPLAGHREAINGGHGTSVFLCEQGKGCPVEIGETFRLRTCGIEITRKERAKEKGASGWRVHFRRIGKASQPYLLKRGGGHTSDPDLAMLSQDEWQTAPTLDTVNPDDRTEAHKAHGEPPEPEGVPPEEVATLRKSMEARLKHREQQRKERAEQNVRTDTKRLAAHMRDVAIRAARHGVDAAPFFAALEQTIKTQEEELRSAA